MLISSRTQKSIPGAQLLEHTAIKGRICIYLSNVLEVAFQVVFQEDSSIVNHPTSGNRVRYHDFPVAAIDSCLLLAECPLFSLYKSSNTKVYFPSIFTLRNLKSISHHHRFVNQGSLVATVVLLPIMISMSPLTSDD